MFADWVLKVKKLNPDDFPRYKHTYPDGRSFPTRLYPNSLLADFRNYFNNVKLLIHCQKGKGKKLYQNLIKKQRVKYLKLKCEKNRPNKHKNNIEKT